MTKKLLVSFAIVITGSFTISSCDKYEDGSNYTIYSAKYRLAREWRLIETTKNGSSENNTLETVDVTYGKKGFYKKVTVTQTNSTNVSESEVGSWDFNEDKTKITIATKDDTTACSILELKASDLKFREIRGDDQYEFTYIAK